MNSLASVIFYSRDIRKARQWYHDILGFEVLYHAPDAFLSMHHQDMGRLDFHPTDDDSYIGRGPLPNFYVNNLADTKDDLESRGIKVSDIQQTGDSPRHAWFWDFEGNVIGLEEQRL